MTNLGSYQLLTMGAKKVGGPVILISLILGAGAIIGYAFGYNDAVKKYANAYNGEKENE